MEPYVPVLSSKSKKPHLLQKTDLLHRPVVEVTVDTEAAVMAITKEAVVTKVDAGPSIQVLKGGTSTLKRFLLTVTKEMDLFHRPVMDRSLFVLVSSSCCLLVNCDNGICMETDYLVKLPLRNFCCCRDTDYKVHIVQRGVVGPLIEMLHSPDAQLRERNW